MWIKNVVTLKYIDIPKKNLLAKHIHGAFRENK